MLWPTRHGWRYSKSSDAADLAQSTVSEHLRILREAGLITATRDGPRIWYSLDRDALEAFLESVRHLTCAR